MSTSAALRPELERLLDAGVLALAAARDDGQRAPAGGVDLARTAIGRGLVTASQARVLAALLGL